MEFQVLGPLEVIAGDRSLDVGGPKQRAVLAVLALRANTVVSTDTLVEAIWGDDVPPSAVGVVRTYVYRLRRQLTGDHARVTSRKPGYVLEVDPDRVDAHRFERLAGRGRKELDAGRPDAASPLLDRALRLWRGDALADVAEFPALRPVATRLGQMRLATVEDRIDAELALGRHAEAVGDLEVLTREHPFRERLWRQLIVALYRSERQADALAAYQTVRTMLVNQLGVGPGPELRALEREVLAQAEGLRWPPLTPAGSERGETGPSPRRERFPTAAGAVSSHDQPFVGRAHERAVLARAFEATRAGEFHALFVTGPPGIGKTALAARFAHDAEAAGASVVVGRADEGAGVPFQPLREAIHHWVRHSDASEMHLLGDIDAEHLGRIAPSLAEQRDSDAPEVVSPVAAADRQRLLEAIARWVEVLGSGRTVVIVLEDLHWADPATVLVVRHLVRHPPPVGALLIATLRDTEIGRDHDLLDVLTSARGDRHVHRLGLAGLTDDDVADLLRSETGDQLSQAGRTFAVRLNQLTGGNPLFIHETLRHLTEQGIIAPSADVWTEGQPVEAFSAPSAVVELIAQRLRRLPAATARVLRPAAVLGQHFELTVLSRIVDLPEIVAVEALEPAIAARLVASNGGVGPGGFSFSHALVRQAIVDGLALGQRARLHWRAGTVLASLSEAHPEARLPEVVYHLTAGVAAGDAHTAVVACVGAGRQALANFAFEDACTWFTTATDLIGTGGVVDSDLGYAAWLGLGQTAGALGRAEDQRTSYLRAAAIARRERWNRRLARAAVGYAAYTTANMGPVPRDEHLAVSLAEEALARARDAPTVDRCLLIATKTVHAVTRDQIDHAVDLAGAAIELAHALDDPTALASALLARCWTLLGTPGAQELDETARRALSIAAVPEARILVQQLVLPLLPVSALQLGDRAALEVVGEHVMTRSPARCSSHAAALRCTWDTAVALCRGRFADADHLIATITDTSDWPVWRTATHLQAAIVSIERGMHAGVEQSVARLLSHDPETVAPRAVLAMLRAHAGDRAEAARHMGILRRHHRLDRLGWSAPLTLRHLAETAARLDDARLASDILPVLEPYSGQMLVSYTATTIDAAADRAIGQLLVALGRHNEAIERLTAAEALERSVGAAALATRTAYWHARARLQRDVAGDREAARQLLHHTSSRAGELGMMQLARDAEEQLQRA